MGDKDLTQERVFVCVELSLCWFNWLGNGEVLGPFVRRDCRQHPKEGNGDAYVQQRGSGCREPHPCFLQAAESRALIRARLGTSEDSLELGCSQSAATPTHGDLHLAGEPGEGLPHRLLWERGCSVLLWKEKERSG